MDQNIKMKQYQKGWLAIATLKPTFTFLVGILESKSIEYDKTRKVKVGFRVAMASQPFRK